MQIDFLLAQTQQFHIRQRHHGKSLIDLERVDVFLLHTRVLQRFRDRQRGRGCEFRRCLRRVAPAEDLSDGFEVVFLERGFGAEDYGCGAVGEGGGVGRGDGAAVGEEGRLDGLELLNVERHLRFIVFIDHRRRLAPRTRNLNRGNLRLEFPGFLGGLCFLDTADGVVVLRFAAEAVVRGAFFALQAHVFALAVGVCEAVAEDAVDELDVAEFSPVAEGGQVVWGVGHGFGAAGDDDVGAGGHDGLGAEDHGFDGGGADFVEGGADGGVGEAGVEGTLAGGVLAETGGVLVGCLEIERGWGRVVVLGRENVAEEDFFDIFGL